jgi:hypothetical protein
MPAGGNTDTSRHRFAVEVTLKHLALAAKSHRFATPFSRGANAILVAAQHDPLPLSRAEKPKIVAALEGAYRAALRGSSPNSEPFITDGANALGTLVLSWSRDRRWSRGSSPYRCAVKLAFAFFLELHARTLADEVDDEQAGIFSKRKALFDQMRRAA